MQSKRSADDTLPKYVPRNVGSSFPRSGPVYEFAVFGEKQGIETLSTIMELIQSYKIELFRIRMHGEKSNAWTSIFLLDFEKADCIVSDFASTLEELDGISSVEFMSRRKSIFDYYSFPVLVNGKHRAFIMRGEVLMGMEKKLAERMGSAAHALMYQEGESFGQGVVRAQAEVLGQNADFDDRVRAMKDASRATGLGILEYRFSEDRDFVEVSLKDPLTDSSGDCQSHFLFGILAGSIETLYNITVSVNSWNYDRQTKVLHLELKVGKK